MDEQKLDKVPEQSGGEGEAAPAKPEYHSPLEPVYENIQVPLKVLDIFIGLCVLALIAVIVVGVLKGNGII